MDAQDRKEEYQDWRELETRLTMIRGVTEAKILLDRWGDLTNVIAIGPNIGEPKRILRDIEGLINKTIDKPIDYRKISITQLDVPPCTTCGKKDPIGRGMARVQGLYYCAGHALAAYNAMEGGAA